MIFVDTSAIYALLDADDKKHKAAEKTFRALAKRHDALVTSSYCLVESYALVQNRLGKNAMRDLQDSLEPLFEVIWIDDVIHQAALDRHAAENRRRLSLVDCASFAIMEHEGIQTAMAYDKHFKEAGFELL